MKRCLFTLLILLTAGHTALAAYRPFTDTTGRTIEAELIKANSTHVWFRLKGGRIVPVALDKLIEADQIFITKWIADKLPDLDIKPDFDRGLNKVGKRNSSTHQDFNMKVEMKNFSSDKSLEESEVIFYLIGRNLTDNDRYKVLSRQVIDVTVPSGEKKEVTFKEINNRFSEQGRRKKSDKKGRNYRGIGYVLQIQRKRDMRLVYLGSSTSLLDHAKEAIISLKEDDQTDESFVIEDKKLKKAELEEKPEKEKEPEVITIQ